jgi:hypothetical protein
LLLIFCIPCKHACLKVRADRVSTCLFLYVILVTIQKPYDTMSIILMNLSCVSWHRQTQGRAVSFLSHFLFFFQCCTIHIDCPERRWIKPWILWKRSVITDNWSSLHCIYSFYRHSLNTYLYAYMRDKYPVVTMSSFSLSHRPFFFLLINSHSLFLRVYNITQFEQRVFFSLYSEDPWRNFFCM